MRGGLTGKFALGVLSLAVALLALPVAAQAKEEDDTPPVLYGLAVNKTVVYPGEDIKVSAVAEDDDSGMRSVMVRFRQEKTGQVLSVTLLPNADQEIDLPYSGVLRVPKGTAAGTYRVVGATVKDWEDNEARYTGSMLAGELGVSFAVAGGGDVPRLTRCSTETKGANQYVQVGVEPGSVPVDTVTLLFENGENNHKITISLKEEDYSDGVYAGKLPVSAQEPAGTFALQRVSIKDTAGEKTVYSARDEEDALPLTVAAGFAVAGGGDLTPPVLHRVEVGQQVPQEDEVHLRVRVTASDVGTGVEHITVKFVHTVTGDVVSKVLRQADRREGDLYAGWLVLKEEDPAGEYRLDSVTLADLAGNRSTYCHPGDANDRKQALPQLPTFNYKQQGSDGQ